MTPFISPETSVNRPAEAIYHFLSDFNNFKNLIPADRVKNYESTRETCSFSIENMPVFHLKMGDNIPVSKVVMIPQDSQGISFTLTTHITPEASSRSIIKIALYAELNSFLKMVASKPLQAFVNNLAKQLKHVMEQQ
ncbi:MAG: hypothetical protein CSA95_07125 [Bacteroidetes bacterium]|nr:MAG: hypothetical protein CSA95_07125 [Bacteroidota bacterium]PIE88032.1 MAG: hypothetical protein CSA04_04040 [Bacteroidota bacterium]